MVGRIIMGNQIATKSLPSREIFDKNPAFITTYGVVILMNEFEQTPNSYPLKGLVKVPNNFRKEVQSSKITSSLG